MNMRWTERGPVVVLVLLAHVALLWAWRFAAAPATRERAAVEPRNVSVLRLIETRPQAADVQPARAPAAPRSPATISRPSPPPDAAGPAAPQAITLPDAAQPDASPPPLALDLSLPRAEAAPTQRTMKEQMRSDPRTNAPRASVESRVAAVAGGSAMTAERMDETKTRFRQNGACIEVHVSRDAQTQPCNQSHSPTPKIVKPSC
jgi:type IV secretory pathway VirB10-like protein